MRKVYYIIRSLFTLFAFSLLAMGCEEKLDRSPYGFREEDESDLIAGALFFQSFTNNGDGTTTDATSGLMWKTCSQGQEFSGTATSFSCRGASGTLANPSSFGAKELQYCSVDLSSCNTLEKHDFDPDIREI
ncbi:hypothetical protein [Leptospira venezuelensis]|uniref:hypothetical protein n=1 Tax=Leptospira venezuelensis TaxID=1958811 RepID=UPI0030043768